MPNVIVLALCSTEVLMAITTKTLLISNTAKFIFRSYYKCNSAPSEPPQANFQEGKYTSTYFNLFCGGFKNFL